jgi:potassium/hydrogen antiporter
LDPVAQTLVVIACILVLGAAGEFIFARTRVPDVVWLVAAGTLAGPVLGVVSSKMLEPGIPIFGAIALTVILSAGAFRLRLSEVAAAAPRGLSLGVFGFVFSVGAMCAFFWMATELAWVRPARPLLWVMAGAIVGGTSSIIIMPTMAMGHVPSGMARMLEVESAATDALSVVIAMVVIDLVVTGSTDLSRPFLALGRELGLGVALGVVSAALLVPGIPALREKAHGYTVFLASMLALYAVTQSLNGNGAMAVLVSALMLGNASSLVPRLFPGAHGEIFSPSETAMIVQEQMTFLIKSFFFFLIGLMFPTDARLIALAALAVLFLLALRLPAVMLSTRGLALSRRDFWLLSVAVPRGLAAGVLATLPLHRGIPEMDALAPAIFALIVWSVLAFSIGFSIVGRLRDAPASSFVGDRDRNGC